MPISLFLMEIFSFIHYYPVLNKEFMLVGLVRAEGMHGQRVGQWGLFRKRQRKRRGLNKTVRPRQFGRPSVFFYLVHYLTLLLLQPHPQLAEDLVVGDRDGDGGQEVLYQHRHRRVDESPALGKVLLTRLQLVQPSAIDGMEGN